MQCVITGLLFGLFYIFYKINATSLKIKFEFFIFAQQKVIVLFYNLTFPIFSLCGKCVISKLLYINYILSTA